MAGGLEAEGGEKFNRGNANQSSKDTIEMIGAEICCGGKVFEGEEL